MNEQYPKQPKASGHHYIIIKPLFHNFENFFESHDVPPNDMQIFLVNIKVLPSKKLRLNEVI